MRKAASVTVSIDLECEVVNWGVENMPSCEWRSGEMEFQVFSTWERACEHYAEKAFSAWPDADVVVVQDADNANEPIIFVR